MILSERLDLFGRGGGEDARHAAVAAALHAAEVGRDREDGEADRRCGLPGARVDGRSARRPQHADDDALRAGRTRATAARATTGADADEAIGCCRRGPTDLPADVRRSRRTLQPVRMRRGQPSIA